MRVLLFGLLFVCTTLLADDDDENVNTKYTVESVSVVPESAAKRVPAAIKADLDALVGQRFDPALADKLRERLQSDLKRNVERRVEKGDKPEHVKVVYSAPRTFEKDADVTKLAYHSKHGWTAGVQTDFDIGGAKFRAGVQSDSDHLLERYAGYNLGVSRDFGDRVRLRFDFGSFHTQWNATTLRALDERPDVPGIYRERYLMTPTLTVALTEPLVFSVGLDFQHFQTQFPAARFEASNALITTLRYRKRWSSSEASRQEVDAGYGLRAATRSLDSDYAYTRHAATVEYRGKTGHHTYSAEMLLGRVNGDAVPLFDRFILGDSRTLRGWSKFDVAPLGGTRVAHGSLEYTYRWLGLFYDTGAVWDQKQSSDVKQSAGVAFGGREGMYLALAFPLHGGSVQPLFILGMNF